MHVKVHIIASSNIVRGVACIWCKKQAKIALIRVIKTFFNFQHATVLATSIAVASDMYGPDMLHTSSLQQ